MSNESQAKNERRERKMWKVLQLKVIAVDFFFDNFLKMYIVRATHATLIADVAVVIIFSGNRDCYLEDTKIMNKLKQFKNKKKKQHVKMFGCLDVWHANGNSH